MLQQVVIAKLNTLHKTWKPSGEGFLLSQCLNPLHNDSTPSFSINLNTGHGHCFCCGYHTNPTFFTEDSDNSEEILRASLYHSLKAKLKVEEYITNLILPPKAGDIAKNWRGLKQDWGLYVCDTGKYANRVIFPIYENSELVGYTGRAIDGSNPKYLHNNGFKSVDTLYPDVFNQTSSTAVIVEGVMDALSLCERGFDSYCNFGLGQFSQKKIANLIANGVENIVVMFDNDAPGIAARLKLENQLKEYFTIIPCETFQPFVEMVEKECKDYNEFIQKHSIED